MCVSSTIYLNRARIEDVMIGAACCGLVVAAMGD
jgi:hypothetical protein